jgi:hypothetical protein
MIFMQNFLIPTALLASPFPKVKLTVTIYGSGDIDFQSGVPTAVKSIFSVQAIELPYTVSKEYLRKTSDVKYDKSFVFFSRNRIQPNYRILFATQNFNVKDVIDLPDNYYFVTCVAMTNELTT